jgi:hypothetical protein
MLCHSRTGMVELRCQIWQDCRPFCILSFGGCALLPLDVFFAIASFIFLLLPLIHAFAHFVSCRVIWATETIGACAQTMRCILDACVHISSAFILSIITHTSFQLWADLSVVDMMSIHIFRRRFIRSRLSVTWVPRGGITCRGTPRALQAPRQARISTW